MGSLWTRVITQPWTLHLDPFTFVTILPFVFGYRVAAFERAFSKLKPPCTVTAWQCMYDHDA
jgi:hypothetical protein